ncbi:hypothetical protein, partial [Desulfocurvus sp. DL9XJH121]
ARVPPHGGPRVPPRHEERLAKIDGHLEDARAASTDAQTPFLDELEAGLDAWSASMDAQFALFAQDPQAGIDMAFDATRELRKTYEEAL